MSSELFVRVNVGGLPFSIAVSDIQKHPLSFFACMIKKEWTADDTPISIERDGSLFKLVYTFLICGQLPRDESGCLTLDETTRQGVAAEADFYGLEDLVAECNNICRKKPMDVPSYMTIRKYLDHIDSDDAIYDIDYGSPLITALKAVWSPFRICGNAADVLSQHQEKIFQNTTFSAPVLNELLGAASQSPFGQGLQTVLDISVRNSFEIAAAELNAAALTVVADSIDISALAPDLKLHILPYKLVIYKRGGHFDAHRDTIRGDGHIGTLVVILNSPYTGGELAVTHGGCTEVVTGAYSWVALYGDCLHKVNPVTSGTRVSLIFDIYGSEKVSAESDGESEISVTREKESQVAEVAEVTEVAEDAEESDNDNDEDSDDDYHYNNNYRDPHAKSFWHYQWIEARYAPPSSLLVEKLTRAQRNAIRKELRAELAKTEEVLICLQHLYPECQSSPAFLKGGDRTLYALLCDKFDVQVVAATVLQLTSDCEDEDYYGYVNARLFSQQIAEEALKRREAHKRNRTYCKSVAIPRVKLVISNRLLEEGVLDYSPYIEHTGNQSQMGRTVYLVAALQVRKKVV